MTLMSKKIEVLAATSQTAVFDRQCDMVVPSDTIKEAQRLAKYYVSGDYEKHMGADASEPLRYSQVVVDGACHSDYFAKGYGGQRVDDETGLVVVK